MSYIALGLMAASVIFQALHAIVQRFVLREKMLSKSETMVAQCGIGALILILYLLFIGYEPGTTLDASSLFWGAVAGTTLANVIIQWANIESRAIADASLTAPLQGMTPGLITVAAILVAEYPGPQGLIGIMLIAVGTWIHGRENARTLKDYLKPFAMLRLPSDIGERSAEEQKRIHTDVRALRYAFLSAGFGTIGLLFDGLISRSGSVALGFAVELMVLAAVFAVPLLREKRRSVRPPMTAIYTGAIGTLFGLHVLLVQMVFRFAPVAYVGSLKRTSIVLTVFLAWVLLGEAKALKRLWPAAIITVGALLLALDPASTAIVDVSYRALGGR